MPEVVGHRPAAGRALRAAPRAGVSAPQAPIALALAEGIQNETPPGARCLPATPNSRADHCGPATKQPLVGGWSRVGVICGLRGVFSLNTARLQPARQPPLRVFVALGPLAPGLSAVKTSFFALRPHQPPGMGAGGTWVGAKDTGKKARFLLSGCTPHPTLAPLARTFPTPRPP